MSKQADTPTSASERENRISRLETIFKTVISSPKSLRQNDDTRLLPHRRKQGAMFTAGDDFFTHILPGISSQLDCLRWEDYQLVRSLRLTIKNSPTAAQSISHLVRRMIEAAQKKNKEILSSQMDKFFPHYSDGQSLDLMTFLGALENEILAHIALNPLYPYVEWSHSNDATPLTQADTDALVKALEEAGFEIMDDFGHGKSSPKVRAMTRNDNVVGIGLMANEAVYMSDHTDDLMKQIIAVGLGPGFVKVCQDCFCDPRMARIVKPPE